MRILARSLAIVALLAVHPAAAQTLPAPWSSSDVGAVGAAGSATSPASNTFSIRGAGADIWGTADAFHFVYRPLVGDGAVVARVASLTHTHDWAKAGVMMRETLAPGSRHAMMVVSPVRGLAFQRRTQTGGESRSTPGGDTRAPHWVRLARSGDVFTAQVSADGLAWRTVGTERIAMAATLYVGLPVTSHDARTTTTAVVEAVSVASGSAAGVTLARQPFLQQVTSGSATIVWTTFEPLAGEVRVGPVGAAASAVPATGTYYPSSRTGLSYDYYQHEATVHGLAAATTYEYEVRVGGVRAFDGRDRFRTAPLPGSGTVQFIAFGDSGTGSAEQRQLAGVMEADTFDFALHTGDVVYGNTGGTGDGTYRGINDWFFLVYERWLRRTPFYPSLGNHDSRGGTAHGTFYLDSFVLPEDGRSVRYPDHTERYYSFDYGPVHFVALDTELAFQDPARRAEQLAWLEATLAATAQPWKIAYFHRTPYSSGAEHGSDLAVRQAFAPIFERYGVQLVLASHEHIYERTTPQPAGSPTPAVYVVTGGGGAPVYPAGTAAWTAYSASAHHYVRVTAGACTLALEAVGLTGSVFDRTTLDRCGGTSPPPSGSGLPTGWSGRDIGAVGRAGESFASGGTFTARGSGADIWGAADGFHFVSRSLTGDGEIVARVASLQAEHHWAKAGVMMRASTAAGAPHAFMLVSAQRGLAFQRRTVAGGSSAHTDGGAGAAPAWVRLVRAGDRVTASRSANGTSWTEVGAATITMGATIHVGLALTSHDDQALATASFDQVRVEAHTAATPGWQGQDIGAVGRAGASFIQGDVMTIDASGDDIWGTADAFHFVHRTLTGDGEIVARVAALQAGHHWAKAGVMIREALTPGSRHAFMLVSAARGFAFQRRLATSAESTHTDGGSGAAPGWVRLVRTGQTIEAYRSADGSAWTLVGRETLAMGATVYVGVAVTSHERGVLARASVEGVRVVGAP